MRGTIINSYVSFEVKGASIARAYIIKMSTAVFHVLYNGINGLYCIDW